MPAIALMNLKGGVAKSTTAVALAECLAADACRTLFIDVDHQCTGSMMLAGEKAVVAADRAGRTGYDLLCHSVVHRELTGEQVRSCVMRGVSTIGGGLSHLDLLPCSPRMDDLQTNLLKACVTHGGDLKSLFAPGRREMRRFVDDYDYVLLDFPPSLSWPVQFFLAMVDGFVIPCVPDRLSVRGSRYLMRRLEQGGHTKLEPLGLLWTLVRGNVRTHGDIVAAAAARQPPYDQLPPPFETIIPHAAAIADAAEPPPAGETHGSFRQKYGDKAVVFERLHDEVRRRAKAAK